MTINITNRERKPSLLLNKLPGHRSSKVLVSTYVTWTIVVMIVAQSTLAAIRNPRFNAILENIQTWTIFHICGEHSVPHNRSKISNWPLTHFCGSCIRAIKFFPFFIVWENFFHKWWTKIIFHLVHFCGQAVNVPMMNAQRFIFPKQFLKCATVVMVYYPQSPLM